MNNRKLYVTLFIGILLNTSIFSQDVHFSQAMNCPLNINPAFTGGFEGDWRFIGNYRNQWQTLDFPFRTYAVSYDRRLYIKNHLISFGGLIIRDQSGLIKLNTNKIFLSGAYHKLLNNHQFSAGIQVGYVFNKVADELYYGHHFDDIDQDFTFNTYPPEVLDMLNYLDINLGVAWKRKIRNFEPQVGIAAYHLNRPNESFFGNKSPKPMRTSIYTGIKTFISNGIFIKPEILFNQIPGTSEIVLGSEAGFNLTGNVFSIREIKTGFYYRNKDAMVITLGAQVRKLYFQISYDYNTSALNKITNSRGAFEMTLIYRSITTLIKTFTIPCERI